MNKKFTHARNCSSHDFFRPTLSAVYKLRPWSVTDDSVESVNETFFLQPAQITKVTENL
jgi:hypothetical protein